MMLFCLEKVGLVVELKKEAILRIDIGNTKHTRSKQQESKEHIRILPMYRYHLKR